MKVFGTFSNVFVHTVHFYLYILLFILQKVVKVPDGLLEMIETSWKKLRPGNCFSVDFSQ